MAFNAHAVLGTIILVVMLLLLLVAAAGRLGSQWLKWSGGYPSYQVRLFRFGQCRFMDFGHGQREDTTGKIGVLTTPYMHYNFSKGRYELGAGTFLDLLNAQVSLAQAKQSYVEAVADAHVAEAALERAVGSRRY